MALDDLDRHLLSELAADARVSMAELGRRIGLSRTATLARVRRLQDDGAIRGYHADVADPEHRPAIVARVAIVVRSPDIDAYVRRIARLGVLREAESIAGEWDLLVLLEAGSAEDLDAALNAIGAWPQTVRTTTFTVLRRHPTTP